MIIKTYIVNDMKEALIRASYELGKEAVIISQRPIRVGKWYNPFKKKKLEVTVAVESNRKKQPAEKVVVNNETRYSVHNLIEKNPVFKNISDTTKSQLLGYCKLHLKEDEYLTTEEIKNFMKMAFKDNGFEKKVRTRKVNVFVGPTGVGKTTTIAKIAARESLEKKRSVGLITIDTYRIGAVEQLNTYAEILNVPCEVVQEPKDMQATIRKLRDCDTILIDTLGTSQRNKEKLDDIKKYLDNITNKTNIHLVMSISTDRETTESILENYKKLNYNALILTKLDEISSFSNLWNIVENYSYPIEYFTHGQDVPDDIKRATLDSLIDYSEEIYQDD
ncbi:MAG TPA: hypothetical protein VK031_05070 [Tissierellaceae bacterium]|nr:hypothetical protein [Tissierellaceae bacterium]